MIVQVRDRERLNQVVMFASVYSDANTQWLIKSQLLVSRRLRY